MTRACVLCSYRVQLLIQPSLLPYFNTRCLVYRGSGCLFRRYADNAIQPLVGASVEYRAQLK